MQQQEEIKTANAGDIVALVGLKDVTTGNTCASDKPIVLEKMDFPDPVIEVAVEPKTKADHEKMGQALGRLTRRSSLESQLIARVVKQLLKVWVSYI